MAEIAQSLGVSTTDQRAASISEFESLYEANVSQLTSYFARRVTEPQLVADLVSETGS
jgi:DNA-directed RNA polymerase specialized sigma24 family protein